MKEATFIYKHSPEKEYTGILLDSTEDINNIKPFIRQNEISCRTKFLKSGEPDNRLDHVLWGLRPIEKALGSLACVRANLQETSAIYLLREVSDTYLLTLMNELLRGGKVIINHNGGITPIDCLEIKSTKDIDKPGIILEPKIRDKTKVINLENDVELERNATNYMTKTLNDNHFSYITELRLYNKEKLIQTFKNFKAKGGEIVYVYTTGRDVEQMYEYSECAIIARLKEFIFQFTTGTDADIDKFITWLSKRVSVKVV